MKRLFSGIALVLATVGSAVAADLPSLKGPPLAPPLPPPPMWTGFYAGLNAGYGFAATTTVSTVSSSQIDAIAFAANNLTLFDSCLGRA